MWIPVSSKAWKEGDMNPFGYYTMSNSSGYDLPFRAMHSPSDSASASLKCCLTNYCMSLSYKTMTSIVPLSWLTESYSRYAILGHQVMSNAYISVVTIVVIWTKGWEDISNSLKLSMLFYMDSIFSSFLISKSTKIFIVSNTSLFSK